jgi:hypothetical protein
VYLLVWVRGKCTTILGLTQQKWQWQYHMLSAMIKRMIPLILQGANQSGIDSCLQPPVEGLPDINHDRQSPWAQWIPELSPGRWVIINLIWCITYAIPLVSLFWRSDNEFYYSPYFYLFVNVASCTTWVLQTTLNAFWFWNNLGLVRAIELIISFYFVVDALIVIFHRDTSNLSTANIVLDYGVGFIAYVWALEVEIKNYIEMDEKMGIHQ